MRKPKSFLPVAQTATELAIFGAILIFVLGLIIRYAVNFSYIQNQSLEAMRLAMQWSWTSADMQHNAARNTASVLFIEDRKDIDATSGGGITDGKFGPLTRTPYVVGGSGTFTKNLFMFTDWGYPDDIPILDMFINGKHFSFWTAGFKTYNLCETGGCNTGRGNLYPGSATNRYVWEPNCYFNNGNRGCVILYTRVANPSFCGGKYCCDSSAACSERFDLDRNGSVDVPWAPDPNNPRAYFSWQWMKVKATNKHIKLTGQGLNISVDTKGNLKEQQILRMRDSAGYTYTPEGGGPPSYASTSEYAISSVDVLDSGAGDLDLTYNGWDAQRGYTPSGTRTEARAGLMDETAIYTYTDAGNGGTYLRIEEGKLHAGKQFIRNVRKRDQVDVIERQVQLSNDTGRFCGNGSGASWDVAAGAPNGKVNPAVQACNDCFNQLSGNISRTCFDENTLILYVRSNLGDTAGKKWTTDVSGDKMPIR